jgi:hypothetical protein
MHCEQYGQKALYMSSATLQFREPHSVVETVLIFTAVAATLLGTAFCLQDRDWAGTLLLSPFVAYLRPTSAVLGAFGGFLPALLHTYAMPVLLIVALRPWPRTRPRVCLLWFSIASTLDWQQSGVTDAWFHAGDRLPGDMPLPGYPGRQA